MPGLRIDLPSQAACPKCQADLTSAGSTRPGLVLDPFAGSGTTGHAAILHGRRFLGNDLRQSQVDLSRRRLEQVSGDGPGSLFAGQTDLQRDFLENLP